MDKYCNHIKKRWGVLPKCIGRIQRKKMSIDTSLDLCWAIYWYPSVLQHLGNLILVAIYYGCFKIVLKCMAVMPDLFLFFMYSFIFTLIIGTWQRLHCCIIAFYFSSSPKWYTYCRPCMWCFINGSTVWLLSWKSREILLSVSFSKLDSVLLTFKATLWAHICFFLFQWMQPSLAMLQLLWVLCFVLPKSVTGIFVFLFFLFRVLFYPSFFS